MKIGTALSNSATKALLLGSGELGKELAIALQRYGVEVIAVDRYPNAPAQHVAHRSHVIDMTDTEAVKKTDCAGTAGFHHPGNRSDCDPGAARHRSGRSMYRGTQRQGDSTDHEPGRHQNPGRRAA